jgi:hypothetical protein
MGAPAVRTAITGKRKVERVIFFDLDYSCTDEDIKGAGCSARAL